MSFASDVKAEIIARETQKKDCCKKAAAYGIACFGKYFDNRGIVLHTENLAVANYAQNVLACVGVKGAVVQKGKDSKEGKGLYEFAVKQPREVKHMLDTFNCTGMQTALTLRINSDNFVCSNCVNTFASSVFLCVGTMTNPEKEYNLEFVSSKFNLLNDFSALLIAQNFTPHHVQRKGLNVLYIKSSEQIEDLLTFMGASSSALIVMKLKIYKDIRNKANRITNCETANIDKIVAANESVLSAIKYLEENGSMAFLQDDLKQTAKLRKEMPSLSLKELAEEFDPPISKSGLSHRLKKITKLASDMRERAKDKNE